jgi:hypothetical protein
MTRKKMYDFSFIIDYNFKLRMHSATSSAQRAT